LTGAIGAEVIVYLVAFVAALWTPGTSLGSAMAVASVLGITMTLPGSVLGSAFGTWLSRSMGWRRPLLFGAISGAALAGLTIALM